MASIGNYLITTRLNKTGRLLFKNPSTLPKQANNQANKVKNLTASKGKFKAKLGFGAKIKKIREWKH